MAEAHPKPCPTCGRCPTCGKDPSYPVQYPYWYPNTYPTSVPSPYITWNQTVS